jgi:hypothetical protein
MGKDKTVEKKESKKDSKETKEVKKQETENEKTEKKTYEINKNTEKANLKLDVNTRKKWLTSYYKRMGYTVTFTKKEKDDDGKVVNVEKSEDTPNISGSQYALAAVEQVLCSTLLNLAYKKAQKTTGGLYNITEELLSNAVQLNPELNALFGNQLSSYKPKDNYLSLLEIKEFKEEKDDKEKTNEICVFAEKYACEGGNSKINLTDDGMNFLMFLLNCNRMMVADCAYWMVKYAKKKQVDDTAVTCAVRNHYSCSKNLCASVCKKLDEVSDLVEDANKAEREEKEAKKKDKDEGKKKEKKSSDKKADKKEEKKSDKKDKKSDKKKAEKEKSESESESESESGSESESESD